jgi:hypothetical protein
MLKHPSESDFEVRSSKLAIEVIFKPTSSTYSFMRLVDPVDIAEFGPLSPDPQIRHAERQSGEKGGTGNYLSPEVQAIAFRLASEAARG